MLIFNILDLFHNFDLQKYIPGIERQVPMFVIV